MRLRVSSDKYNYTNEELTAVLWAKASYGRNWRSKRFSKTREQHNACIPVGIMPEVWDSWYEAPFGVPEWNARTKVLRRLQAEGRL